MMGLRIQMYYIWSFSKISYNSDPLHQHIPAYPIKGLRVWWIPPYSFGCSRSHPKNILKISERRWRICEKNIQCKISFILYWQPSTQKWQKKLIWLVYETYCGQNNDDLKKIRYTFDCINRILKVKRKRN